MTRTTLIIAAAIALMAGAAQAQNDRYIDIAACSGPQDSGPCWVDTNATARTAFIKKLEPCYEAMDAWMHAQGRSEIGILAFKEWGDLMDSQIACFRSKGWTKPVTEDERYWPNWVLRGQQ
jgi:hypothetical protein